MESQEFAKITVELEESFDKLLQRIATHLSTAQKSKLFDNAIEDGNVADTLQQIIQDREKFCKKLKKVIDETGSDVADTFTVNNLHICLNFLADINTNSEEQNNLINQWEKKIQEYKAETTKVLKRKEIMERSIIAREEEGEMTELRGYSPAELKTISKEIKASFVMHREKMKQTLAKLYPERYEEVNELLALLCKGAFSDAGLHYVDLNDYPHLGNVASDLLQCNVIHTHPQRSNLLQICIVE